MYPPSVENALMSETSRILIEYGTSLRAVCAHSLLVTSLTHWLSSGSVTTTVESVICLSYCLPIWTSCEVFSADTGDGMLAHVIAKLSAMTAMRRNGIMTGFLGSAGRGSAGTRVLRLAAPAFHQYTGNLWVLCGQQHFLVQSVWTAQGRIPGRRNGRG